jgi:hypothetical protein
MVKKGLGILGVLLLAVGLSACAAIYVMKVHYQVPWEDEGLRGKKLYFSFKDERADKEFLTKSAKKEFRSFSDRFSFSTGHADKPGHRMGVYDLAGMFEEAFSRRLENLGVDVVEESGDFLTGLVIALQSFRLDLDLSVWKASIEYEARLVHNGNVLATQDLRGQAERFKWVGRGEADKAVSEIFSDTINRLDLERLYGMANIH